MSILGKELIVGSMRAKNRFVRAATYEALATDEGHMTPELFRIYEELAEGGAGTIIVGYAFVTRDEQPNANMLGIYDDSFIPEYRALVDMAHGKSAAIISQIVYGGSASKLDPLSRHILGPSAIANPKTGIVPVEASKGDLAFLVKSFAAAAGRAKQAGFDGVELHAAHGYLLSQFLSPHLNQRTDEYGDTVENRARIILEIVEEVRDVVGEDYPLFVKLNSSDGVEGGLTEEDSVVVAKLLEAHGVDALEISGPWRTCKAKDFGGEPFFAAYAKRLAREVKIPLILTGGNHAYGALEQLAEQHGIAGFGLCRPLICEPDLVRLWESDPCYSPRCVYCNACSSTPGHRCILTARENDDQAARNHTPRRCSSATEA